MLNNSQGLRYACDLDQKSGLGWAWAWAGDDFKVPRGSETARKISNLYLEMCSFYGFGSLVDFLVVFQAWRVDALVLKNPQGLRSGGSGRGRLSAGKTRGNSEGLRHGGLKPGESLEFTLVRAKSWGILKD